MAQVEVGYLILKRGLNRVNQSFTLNILLF